MATKVKVFTRVRPLSAAEISEGCEQPVQAVEEGNEIIVGGNRNFPFDGVFGVS